MSRTINDEIKKAGIKYLGHYNKAFIEVIGSTWKLEIPQNRTGDFTRLFPEIQWEDGKFIEEIKGKYLRVTYDDNMKIYSLHHIVKPIDYMINVKKKDSLTVKEYNTIYLPKIDHVSGFIYNLEHAMQKTDDYEGAMKQLECIGWCDELKETVRTVLEKYKSSLLNQLDCKQN